ncbi:uncharacterized protein LOC143266359 [Megachile rotundata]|uniref:uncharacterized protein LOC143266359 n=1 Tax=Megachile rotundata TaxID=143995 RepID=UPI003FCF5802
MALQLAIKESKDRAWDEFLGSLERDRWGRPYKLVMEKLRPWAPPVAETLDPQFLGSVVEALFPREEHPTRTGPLLRLPRSDGVEVTVEDLVRAVRRVKARSTAPGPDGVPSRVLSLVLPHLGQRVARLFTACLREGTFPGIWKRGRLVLLRKAGRPEDEPSSYRPIVLLDEIGKLFERVIAERLVAHLSGVGPDLAPCQFGFRKERSTVDAVRRVRAIAEAATSRGGLAIAVSLDIVNAFNSLPYWAIEEGLVIHCVPGELRDIVSDYLRGRTVECVDREGVTRVWTVERGVPQGAALGPDLWLVGYNAALTVPLPDGVFGTCFADDTHILAVGRDWGRTSRNLEVGIAAVVSAIRRLGLEVAPRKTEAMAFCHPRGDKPPEGAVVRVDGVEVRIGTEMRYLGLLLDSHWSFEGHFNALAPRLGRTADALARLLPNLRGPSESVLSGHGCFAEYLCRMGRESSPQCYHCGEGPDTAQHTLSECPAFAWERHFLQCEVGDEEVAAHPQGSSLRDDVEELRGSRESASTALATPHVVEANSRRGSVDSTASEAAVLTRGMAMLLAKERTARSPATSSAGAVLARSSDPSPSTSGGLVEAGRRGDFATPILRLSRVDSSGSRSLRRDRSPFAASERADSGEESDISISSVASLGRMTSRKRTKPQTAGEYRARAEAKRQLLETHRKEAESAAERAVFDPTVDPRPPCRAALPLDEVDDIAKRMDGQSDAEIVAEALEHGRVLEKVASNSKNLKGTYVRAMRESTRYILAAAVHSYRQSRTSVDAPQLERENILLQQKLRARDLELDAMRREVEVLRREMDGLKSRLGVGTRGRPSMARRDSVSATREDTVGCPSPGSMEVEVVPSSGTPIRVRGDRSPSSAVCSRVPSPCAPSPRAPSPRPPAPCPPPLAAPSAPPLSQGGDLDRFIGAVERLIETKITALREELLPAVRSPRTIDQRADRQRPTTAPPTKAKARESKGRKTPSAARQGGVIGRTPPADGGRGALVPPPPPPPHPPPPPAPAATTEEWSKVVGRRAKKVMRQATAVVQQKPAAGRPTPDPPKRPGTRRLPKPPRTAAVTITVAPGGPRSYADIMREAREKVPLAEVGIAEVRYRQAVTGAMVLEVPGEGGAAKADALAGRLRVLFDHNVVKVSRPVKCGECRIVGLDPSVTSSEVRDAVVAASGCNGSDVRTGEVRTSPVGVGTIWVRCPLAALNKIVAAKRIRVGWLSARVEALPTRPLQCYRCLEAGHVRQRCNASVDRSSRCYKCGESGHVAGQCSATPRCPLCTDLGRPAGHRLGAKSCAQSSRRRGRQLRKERAAATVEAAKGKDPAHLAVADGHAPGGQSGEAPEGVMETTN